ncbi:MAG: DUF4241 domain-containing protein [Hyphomicrobiaceae bacterium]|nr:DUF4241 domain-containing protein [Hyphomicrobiaceae bacterium]
MSYPNEPYWGALTPGPAKIENYVLSVYDCGKLRMPTGQLVACDPFAAMQKTGNPAVAIPPGDYTVKVTLADVSDKSDGSHVREAYATLLIDDTASEVTRRIITPLHDAGNADPEIGEDGDYHGFPVDAGTACFVDAGALVSSMPDEATWYEGLFENDRPDSWFNLMDNPSHLREGLANITLPLAKNGENIVIIHSGWGDGFYPVVGGFDASGRLIRVHIDFMVVFPGDED